MITNRNAQIAAAHGNPQGFCAKAHCIRGVFSRDVDGVPARLRQHRPGSVFGQGLVVSRANANNIVAQGNDLLYSARRGLNAKAIRQKDYTRNGSKRVGPM
jgi:hypothetical protein